MTLLGISPTLSALAALCLTLLYVVYRAALPRPIPGIPYNKEAAGSLLGDLPEFLGYVKASNGQVLNWLHLQVEKHDSPIIQLFLRPFGRPAVVVADFREAQDVLLRRSKEFDRSRIFDDVFSGVLPYHHIIQKTTGKVMAQKRLLADTMSTSFLNEVAAPRIHEATLDLIRLWTLKANLAKGLPFEAQEDIAHTTLDAIWVVVLGSPANTIANQANNLETMSSMQLPKGKDEPLVFPRVPHPPAFDAILTLSESVTPLMSSPLPKLHHWFLRQSKSYKNAKRYKDQEIETMMEAAIDKFSEDQVDPLEKQGKDRSAIDHMIRRELLASRKEGRTKDELLGFLIAGHETTATTTAWAVKLLSDNHQAQSELRKVLRSTYTEAAVERRQPTAKEIATLHHPYIDAFLEEILRCGGTIAVLSRSAMTRSGYVTPPVGIVQEHTRSASSQASKDKTGVWEVSDINVFKPERWLKLSGEKGEVEFHKNAGPTLQFGAGIRGCFGRRLAYIELRVLIVLIIWNFEFLPVPGKLGTYLGVDKLTHQPQQCYLRLKKAEW
ncbi:hypothetical protein QM012_004347 [Aureobasidium pullulans]|uniref:Cytochrome P450 n=1 Tax=Aureobasidium pullulans TaxID=5580 RepID=A0ABR0TSV6_AURPU